MNKPKIAHGTLEGEAKAIYVKSRKQEAWMKVREGIIDFANVERRNFSSSLLMLLELGIKTWKEQQ